MKNRNQTGSTHLVIIIILVVALLGVLGFVFWQNFIEKPATTTNTTAQTTPGQAYLNLTDLGIKIPYDSSADTLTVSKSSNSAGDIFYDINSRKASDACAVTTTSTDAGTIGIVSRDIANDKTAQDSPGAGKTWLAYVASQPHVVIGQYVYVLTSPQQGCADPSTTAGAAANITQEDAYNTLKGNFQSLTQL